MKDTRAEICLEGKTIHVPSACINGRTVLLRGRWIRVAVIADEEWLEGEVVEDPKLFVTRSRAQLKADIFTFSQKLPETKPKYQFPMEWDSFAAISVTTFSDWLEKQVPKEVRQNIKKAARMGVVVKEVEFDDELVKGIMAIYNETPTRQGRRFWHYGKDFETIKKELSTYVERSQFIGAYCQNELIGFVKLVQVGKVADIMHILCRTDTNNKKPVNALLAKAVDICEKNRVSYLLYGHYAHGKKRESSLIDFKSRNGFREILLPRYYIPLTTKGKLVLKLKLHHGIRGLIPQSVIDLLLNLRARFYERYDTAKGLFAKWNLPPKVGKEVLSHKDDSVAT